jgi:hypothetical protein
MGAFIAATRGNGLLPPFAELLPRQETFELNFNFGITLKQQFQLDGFKGRTG